MYCTLFTYCFSLVRGLVSLDHGVEQAVEVESVELGSSGDVLAVASGCESLEIGRASCRERV